MEKALPYVGWALLAALLIIWAGQKFLGDWIEAAAASLRERIVGRFAAGRWFRRAAVHRYVAGILEDYDKVPVPFIEREDQRPSVRKIYVPLQTLDEGERRQEDDAYEDVRRCRRSVVIGPPGSGKSMLLKTSTLVWAEGAEHASKDHHIWKRRASPGTSHAVPVLVELRRCLPADGIAGVSQLIIDQFADHGFKRADRFVNRALDDGDLTVLFDGLDEVATANRKAMCDVLTAFASRYAKCQMVVTCRTAIYKGQLSEKFADVVRVADFDDVQIRRFMRNWQRSPGSASADQLIEVLRDVPRLMQLARNPLLLTLIVYLYAHRGKETRLPRSRSQFYKEATDFLLRNKPELDYSQGTKMAVLQRLALIAQDRPAADLDRQVLPYPKVIEAIKSILPATALREEDVQPLLDEIVARSGIIKEIRGEQSYHFAHLTLQEFLAAVELADRPDDLLQRYRSDPAIWREVIKLWCGYVSRDSKPVISEVFDSDPVLAFECIADAVQVDETLSRKITEYFEERLGSSGADDDAVAQAFGAVASDGGPRGQAVLSFLIGLASAPGDARHTAAVHALAASKLPRAADVLASVYIDSAAAREWLPTMGDLAVPAYAERAGNGELDAVDNLATVGTPAAARELVRLLSADTDVASRAAWRIASLIRNPDVEEALRTSDDLSVPSGPELAAVWEPFREQSSAAWVRIVGRVAYLINDAKDGAVPDVLDTDRRLAIPLCSVAILNAIQGTRDFKVGPDLSEQFLASRRATLPLHPGDVTPSAGVISHRALTFEFSYLPEDFAQSLVPRVIQASGVSKVHRLLFAELTWNLQFALFKKACENHRNIDLSDWPDVFISRREPRIFKTIWTSLTWGAVVCLAIYAGYSTVRLLLGNWNWGPLWLPWAEVGIWVLVILAVSVFFSAMESRRKWLKPLESASLGLFLLGVLLTGGLAILYASVGIREYLGWTAAIGMLSFVAVILGGLWLILRRRVLAAANPLRGLLEIDEAAARNRTSIIA